MNGLISSNNCYDLYYTESAFSFSKWISLNRNLAHVQSFSATPKFYSATHPAQVRALGVTMQSMGEAQFWAGIQPTDLFPFILGPASFYTLDEKEAKKKANFASWSRSALVLLPLVVIDFLACIGWQRTTVWCPNAGMLKCSAQFPPVEDWITTQPLPRLLSP